MTDTPKASFGYDDLTAITNLDIDVDQPTAWRRSDHAHRLWGPAWFFGYQRGLHLHWYPNARILRLKILVPRWTKKRTANCPLQPLRGVADLRPAEIRDLVATAMSLDVAAVPPLERWEAYGAGVGIDVETSDSRQVMRAAAAIRRKRQRKQPDQFVGHVPDDGSEVMKMQGHTVTFGGRALVVYDKTAELEERVRQGKAPKAMRIPARLVRVETNLLGAALQNALGASSVDARTLAYVCRPDVADYLFSSQVSRLVMPEAADALETPAQRATRELRVLREVRDAVAAGERKLGRPKTVTTKRLTQLACVIHHRETPPDLLRDMMGISAAALARLRSDLHDIGLDGSQLTEPFSREVAPHLAPWKAEREVPAPQPGETVPRVGQSLSRRMRAGKSTEAA